MLILVFLIFRYKIVLDGISLDKIILTFLIVFHKYAQTAKKIIECIVYQLKQNKIEFCYFIKTRKIIILKTDIHTSNL